jgi:hypothetical protein
VASKNENEQRIESSVTEAAEDKPNAGEEKKKKRPGERKFHRTALVFGVVRVGEEVQARKFWAAGIQMDVGGKGQWPRRR